MTATEIFESVTHGGASDFAQVVSILDRTGPWCLIGGLAVNCYVEPVYTMDADVVVATENFSAINNELNVMESGSKLNVRFTRDERYQEFIAEAERREVLGCKIPVAKLEDIVRGKVWAWQDETRRPTKRKKDELDLFRIAEAYPQLRHLIPNDIVAQLGDV